jgi:hypothetical protein
VEERRSKAQRSAPPHDAGVQQSKLTGIAAGWRAGTSNIYFQNLEKALKSIRSHEGEESKPVYAKARAGESAEALHEQGCDGSGGWSARSSFILWKLPEELAFEGRSSEAMGAPKHHGGEEVPRRQKCLDRAACANAARQGQTAVKSKTLRIESTDSHLCKPSRANMRQ